MTSTRVLAILGTALLAGLQASASDGYSLGPDGFTFTLQSMACRCTTNDPSTYTVTVPLVTTLEYGGECTIEGWCSILVTTGGTTQHQFTIPLGYCLVGGSISFLNVDYFPMACVYGTDSCPDPQSFLIGSSNYAWVGDFIPCPP